MTRCWREGGRERESCTLEHDVCLIYTVFRGSSPPHYHTHSLLPQSHSPHSPTSSPVSLSSLTHFFPSPHSLTHSLLPQSHFPHSLTSSPVSLSSLTHFFPSLTLLTHPLLPQSHSPHSLTSSPVSLSPNSHLTPSPHSHPPSPLLSSPPISPSSPFSLNMLFVPRSNSPIYTRPRAAWKHWRGPLSRRSRSFATIPASCNCK